MHAPTPWSAVKIEAKFYETYKLCVIVSEILADQFEYSMKLNAAIATSSG